MPRIEGCLCCSRRQLLTAGGLWVAIGSAVSAAPASKRVTDKLLRPAMRENVLHVISAMKELGQPIAPEDVAKLKSLTRLNSQSWSAMDAVLDKYTLLRVRLNGEGVGQSKIAGASPQLVECGWRTFLVRVENPSGLTGDLLFAGRGAVAEGQTIDKIDSYYPRYLRDQWMGYRFGVRQPTSLQGLPLEYQILQVYSQVSGQRQVYLMVASSDAQIASGDAQMEESHGVWARFKSSSAGLVTLSIADWDREGTTASLIVRDSAGRLYPAPAHRMEPDLVYEPQVYRADGETLRLPEGSYSLIASRGPEYLLTAQSFTVPSSARPVTVKLSLKRWIDPSKFGWFSGDPHFHGWAQMFGFVSRYGVTSETLVRKVRGEGLNVGSPLVWRDGYDFQRRFISGNVYEPTYRQPWPAEQRENNSELVLKPTPHDRDSVIRWGVEQAGFSSDRSGHLVLLRIPSHEYPGAVGTQGWPKWGLPILRWAKALGGIVGFGHVGYGMDVPSDELPNYDIPSMDFIGANECVMAITHGAVDFLCAGEVDPKLELNVWYHLLNCGFALPMVGESDIGARIGSVRTYVKIDGWLADDHLYDAWVEGIRQGRVYFGDGRSHIIDFLVNGVEVGGGLELPVPGVVRVTAKVAARLWPKDEPPRISLDGAAGPQSVESYWKIARAEIGQSGHVPVEVVVNGRAVRRTEIPADGSARTLSWDIDIAKSSWVALRILPSCHTAAVGVTVGSAPVRVSRRSAQWCLDCVDVVWGRVTYLVDGPELAEMSVAWNHAREVYRKILAECTED